MNMYVIKEDKLEELSHKDRVRFALFCVNQVKDRLTHYNETISIIEQVELWLEDKATSYDCFLAVDRLTTRGIFINSIIRYAAWTTHENSSPNRCSSAYYASRASAMAAVDLLNDKIINEQVKYYNELRYVDDIFETIVLEGNEKPFR